MKSPPYFTDNHSQTTAWKKFITENEIARKLPIDGFVCMFTYAAELGDETFCRVLKKSSDEDESAIYNAQKYGYVGGVPMDVRFENMLLGGVRGNHEHICKLAIQWGAVDLSLMLKYATIYAHERLCQLAKKKGANNWIEMFREASLYGHAHFCELAWEWSKKTIPLDDLAFAFRVALRRENEHLCKLVWKLGNGKFTNEQRCVFLTIAMGNWEIKEILMNIGVNFS